MKAKAILFASVLLFGSQVSRIEAKSPEQHAQSLSSATPGKSGTIGGRKLPPRWQDDGTGQAQSSNLWQTISAELKMRIPNDARIREQKVNYLRNKSYLYDVTSKAEPYMYWIVDQIQLRKMPMELVLLPIVESAFDPHATSSANAAGLWQIVSSTGRNYGLKQTNGTMDAVTSSPRLRWHWICSSA